MTDKSELQKQIILAVETVKQSKPLAGSITNTVTINLVANAQIAVGGSAAMVYLPDEAEALIQAGSSFYINVGTLFPVYEQTLPRAAKVLCDTGTPWVLDPVAIGIGTLRTALLKKFQEFRPTIIRGNASEILALAGLWNVDGGTGNSRVRGVDSTDAVSEAKHAAAALARMTGGAVAVSGRDDFITDGHIGAVSCGGSHFMEEITGSGCSLGGVAAVYAAAASPFIAALTAAAVYNLAGRRAERKAEGPASFQTAFLDELYRARPEEIAQNPFTLEEAEP